MGVVAVREIFLSGFPGNGSCWLIEYKGILGAGDGWGHIQCDIVSLSRFPFENVRASEPAISGNAAVPVQ